MKTLYWTADSPFCRIVLWCLYQSHLETQVRMVHLSWQGIRDAGSTGHLGPTATVPCLITEDGTRVGDSLRIISFLNPELFSNWFLSQDGECHRVAEGQLSRILYALYDGVSDKRAAELRAAWLRTIAALNALITASGEESIGETRSPSSPLSSTGCAFAHILLHFCLYLKPEWKSDISVELQNQLQHIENREAFRWMKAQVENQAYRVPCAGTSAPLAR